MSERSRARTPYIVSAGYDGVFFLAPPLLALLTGIAISNTWLASFEFELGVESFTVSTLFIGVFIHAHLVLVFFRSHGNKTVRRRFPVRFLAIPPLLWAAMMVSPWILVGGSVLATFWDVYHSGAQTFGFGRIYDRKLGNDPRRGRWLDWGLNQLLYAGPILAGVTMIDHFEDFLEFEHVGTTFFSHVPVWMEGHQAYFAWAVVAAGTGFLVFYVVGYWRLARSGYRVSMPKVWLFATTGFCSVYTWGFNSWGEAFFIMNLFHALQYFGIVWATEKRNIQRMLRLEGVPGGLLLTGMVFLGLPALYGLGVQLMDANIHALWAGSLVVALMHFWYDGFIWSVGGTRRGAQETAPVVAGSMDARSQSRTSTPRQNAT